MIFTSLTSETRDQWNAICQRSDDAWLYHTTDMMQLYQEYLPETESQNHSFLISDDSGKIVGICPLFLEKVFFNGSVYNEFSSGKYALPGFALINELSLKSRDELIKEIFTKIDNLAKEYKVHRCTLQFSPLLKSYESIDSLSPNLLQKFGFLGYQIPTQIMDCRKPKEVILKRTRKGHAADMKRAQKLMEFVVFNHVNTTPDIFQMYQDLHFKAAGRKTRPQITFDLMYKMLMNDQMFLVGARTNGSFVGFGLFEFFKGRACYSSAANDPDFAHLPISHGIQAKTIEYLFDHNCELYELGWQHFGPQLTDIPSDKEKSISHFKRGFGGQTRPIIVGEKFYDKEFCLRVLNSRTTKYIGAAFD